MDAFRLFLKLHNDVIVAKFVYMSTACKLLRSGGKWTSTNKEITHELWMKPGYRGMNPPSFDRAFTVPSVADTIFTYVSVVDLFRFGRTCRRAHVAVSSSRRRLFNIHRHLSYFLIDPLGFRDLQARTGTLISGSNALQFLDRTTYSKSDLDVYTHRRHGLEVGKWLMEHEDYQFEAVNKQPLDFQHHMLPQDLPRPSVIHLADDKDELEKKPYSNEGIEGVYEFSKVSKDGAHSFKIQVVTTVHAPIDCIMRFHSSTLPFL